MITHSKPTLEKDDFDIVLSQMKTGMISKGDKVRIFEKSISKYIGSYIAVSTCSGKSALILSLLLLGVRKGDEVILPTYVCRSVYDAVLYLGASPVVIDINDNYCISSDQIKNNISKKTKAIIVVHIFGITAEIIEIVDIANEKGIPVIEDIAQAIGGEINDKKLGSFGHISFGSLQATKMITCGEGGFLLINDKKILQKYNKKYYDKNFIPSLSDISAVLAYNQLIKINVFLKKRNILAKKYISNLKLLKKIDIPILDLKNSIFFRFPVKIKEKYDFNLIRNIMSKEGIQIRKGVDFLLHNLDLNFKCLNAEKIYKETVSLPIYPLLKLPDIDKICNKLSNILK